jgi:siroheme synthase
VTGSAVSGATVDFRRLANPDLTLVVLMGIRRRRTIARELVEGGLDPKTPVAVVERASTDQQRVLRCTLAELGERSVSAPAVLVIGAVAALDLGRVGALTASYAFTS